MSEKWLKVGDKIRFKGLDKATVFKIEKIEGKYGKVVLKGLFATRIKVGVLNG